MASSSWLQDLLAGLNQSRAGVDAYSNPQTGGATPTAPAQGQSAQAGGQDPFAALLAGFQAFQQRRQGALPGLEQIGASGGNSLVQLQHASAGTPGTGLGGTAAVTQQGARAGQAHQTYSLPGGKKANVYYDAAGRRRVYVY